MSDQRGLVREIQLVLLLSLPVVTAGATTVTLATSANPVTYGKPLTLTATVSPASATGKVTFYDGVTILGIGTLSGGTASTTTIFLPSGARSLRAYYRGDAMNASASSAVAGLMVTVGASNGFRQALNVVVETSGSLNSIAVGDFNGDHKPDLVAVDYLSQQVSVLLGNGNGSFQPPLTLLDDSAPVFVVVGDWNGDGKLDLAIGDYVGVSLILGNGDGTFQARTWMNLKDRPQSLVVGDFNGDGVADLALGCNSVYTSSVAVLIGKGDGTFQAPVYYTSWAPGSIVVADFNRDGAADLAYFNSSGTLEVLPGKGDGTFGIPIDSSHNGGVSGPLAAGDFNGDGKLDLLAPGTIFLGNGDGTFQAQSRTTQYGLLGVAAADVNGDGDLDAINTDPGGLNVQLGSGNGTFQAPVDYLVPPGATSVASADFNGDGMLDMAVGGGGIGNNAITVLLGGPGPDLTLAISHGIGFTQGQAGALYSITASNVGTAGSIGTVTISNQLPNGMTATSIIGSGWSCVLATLTCSRSDSLGAANPPLVVTANYPPILIALNVSNQIGNITDTATISGGGDTNPANNSASDTTTIRPTTSVSLTSSPNPSVLGQTVTIIATVSNGTGKVTFYDGASTLGVATLVAGQASFATATLGGGSHLLTARFDGDANYGRVLSAPRAQIVSVAPAGAMQPGVSYPTGVQPNSIAAGDFNRDGIPDLVTGNANDLSILVGNSDGSFRPAVSIGSGFGVKCVAVGDVNGDGNSDLAIAYSDSSNTSALAIALGHGDGTFSAPVQLAGSSVEGPAWGLSVSDVNQDGLADLIFLNGLFGAQVYLGNGDGTFQSPLPNTNLVTYWALADVNGDGRLDIASAATYGLGSLLIGNGEGTFQEPAPFTGLSGTIYGVAAGDFNRDGKVDVLELSSSITFIKGNGNGTFQSPVTYNLVGNMGDSAVNSGFSPVVGDFNGDGNLDVLYRSVGSSVGIIAGNGDGSFQAQVIALPTDGLGGAIATGDFNRDGRLDFAVANSTTNTVDVFLGGQYSRLAITSSHVGRFVAGSIGSYQILVSNPSFLASAGAITVTDRLPAGLTVAAMSGPGWNCIPQTLTCSISTSLASGAALPAIVLTVNVGASVSPSTLNNQVTVSLSGAVSAATDPTTIVNPTSTSLTVTPSPAQFGQPVTLTAMVTGSGASGRVSFMDGGSLLGTVALVNGQAALTTRLLPAGSRSLMASYGGDGAHSASHSQIQTVSVHAVLSGGWGGPSLVVTGDTPLQVLLSDFNNDGQADLATLGGSGRVSVLLSNGDGTFQPHADTIIQSELSAAVAGDFNGDGKQDMVVAQAYQDLIVLLGKGDGTFEAAHTLPFGPYPTYPLQLLTTDFDLDGNADLMVVLSTGEVRVLLGNGDGTFRTKASVGNGSSTAVAIADFNGDGIPDAVFATSSGIYIEMGNGDGTFSLSQSLSGSVLTLIAGDLNGDGVPDLVTVGTSVETYICHSDGSCTAASSYKLGGSFFTSAPPAIADINGDGKLDVIIENSGLLIMLGNGDGTLQPPIAYATNSTPNDILATDLNGDGRTDVLIANSLSSLTVTILLGATPAALQVSSTHNGNFLFNQSGATYTLTATNQGPGTLSGVVTVVDTLPSGLIASAINGTGWTCTLATLTCTQTASLVAGASLPSITVTVNVTISNPVTVTNRVSASSPGSVTGTANDPTNITALAAPVLTSPDGGQTGLSLSPGALLWNAVAGATSYQVYFGTQSNPPLVATTISTSYSTVVLTGGTLYYWRIVAMNDSGSASSSTRSFTTAGSTTGSTISLAFYPITPCRVADTRVPAGFTGQFGPPSMAGGSTRVFNVLSSSCASSIPSSAAAYALNFTVVPPSGGPQANLTTWPAGAAAMPNVSTLNYAGSVVANAAIVPAGTNGAINVFANYPTDVLFDITGYFAPPASSGLEFYTVTPCRVADTRVPAGFSGQFGPPTMAGGSTRTFNLPASGCGVPSTASAFALNFTVVPQASDPAANLTTWPAGAAAMPNVSTLNYSNKVVANAAIVPAGTNESINVFVNYPTDVLFDVNGYFAPPATNGLHFYPVTPCRVADTRVPAGFTGQFGPPTMTGGSTRTFNIPASGCGIPSTAVAYSMNFTVVPPSGGLAANLTTWPAGGTMPNVSTLNYYGSVVANAAIVPAGANGAISVFVNYTTDVLFDINGYFAP